MKSIQTVATAITLILMVTAITIYRTGKSQELPINPKTGAAPPVTSLPNPSSIRVRTPEPLSAEEEAVLRSLQPRKALAKNPPTSPLQGNEHQVVVKFRDALRARTDRMGRLSIVSDAVEPEASQIFEEFGLKFRALYTGETAETMKQLEKDAADKSGLAQPDFLGMMVADIGTTDPARNLEAAMALHALDMTEFVNVHAIDAIVPPPPSDPGSPTDNYVPDQEWRNPDPGLDVMRAWGSNGKGQGVRMAVIEYGFNPNHEEFVGANITSTVSPGNPASPSQIGHGTMTLGVIAAQENGYGVDGIAPEAEIRFYSEWDFGGPTIGIRRGITIAFATQELEAGDIMLLEMQTDAGVALERYGPAELEEEVFITTKAAVDKGIIVVSGAGNGNVNLDSAAYKFYRDYGNSGAIIVGSSLGGFRQKNPESSFGSRVDVHSWGSNVLTAGGDGAVSSNGVDIDENYSRYSGTSSASAIVAGVCASWQSMQAASNDKRKLTPNQMRSLIRALGFDQNDPERGRIGRAVSLAKISNLVGGRPLTVGFGESKAFDFDGTAVLPNTLTGWQISQEPEHGMIHTGAGRLTMTRPSTLSEAALNTATLHLDLEEKGNVIISFKHTDKEDTFEELDGDSYVGTADVDGIFISNDGIVWHKVDLTANGFGDGIDDNNRQYAFSLDKAAREAGIRFGENFRVRFQSFSAGNHRFSPFLALFSPDSRSFDNITVFVGANGMLELAEQQNYIAEDAGEATFKVVRTNGSAGTVSVQYVSSPNSATGDDDYHAQSGIITFADGETEKEFAIPICDDEIVEGIETFTVRLDFPGQGAYLGSHTRSTVKILDNDFVNGRRDGYRFQRSVPDVSLPQSEGDPDPEQNYLELKMGVSDVPGTITDIQVTLYDFWHGEADDLHLLLKSPSGVNVMLMSDAGGQHPFFVNSLRFGTTGAILPQNTQLENDTVYVPANYPPGLEALPPEAGFGLPDLSVLNGTDPNDKWSLFIVDGDDNGKTGRVMGGWELIIKTTSSTDFAGSIDRIRVTGANPGNVELDVLVPESEPFVIISSPSLPFSEADVVNSDYEGTGTGSPQTIEIPRRSDEKARYYRIGSGL